MAEQMADIRERKIGNVINEYGNRLFRFIRGRVTNNADAEDIAQEVWFQLSRVVELDSIEQVGSWLFRVARNRITDTYRKEKHSLLEDEFSKTDSSELYLKDLLASDADSEDEEILKELFWEELFKALDELPKNQKEVFVWNELEEETYQEISDRTGINIKTLISRKGYAVKHLRSRLKTLYTELLEH